MNEYADNESDATRNFSILRSKLLLLDPHDVSGLNYFSDSVVNKLKSLPETLSADDANEAASFIVDLTSSSSLPGSCIAEVWKFYVKLLKINSQRLSAEACNRIADSLSKMLSDGIAGVASAPSEARLSLLFFYAQRASATLAYCCSSPGKLDSRRTSDLFYLLASARGVLHMSSVPMCVELRDKMDTNFQKALFHPETMDGRNHRALYEKFKSSDVSAVSSSSSSSFALLQTFPLCRSLGVIFFSANEISRCFAEKDPAEKDLSVVCLSLSRAIEDLVICHLGSLPDSALVEILTKAATSIVTRFRDESSEVIRNSAVKSVMVSATFVLK